MFDFADFIDFVEFAKRHREVGPRRYLRDYSDPFRKYSTREFQERYRFTPESVKSVILPLLAPDLRKPTKRGLPFAPEIMVLLSLRYYATGSLQKLDFDVMNICQQSVSRIIAQVSLLIASKMKDFVKLPSTENEINAVKQKFYEVAHFPEVIGCIGCTHIKIRSPSSEEYRNSKGYFSINVQAVTGPNLEFYDLVARWPGSTDDSFIYENSGIKQRLNSGKLKGVILGDSGYEVSSVLLTPFLSPNSIAQENYNRSLIETRNTVEKCFGVWKKRFPCLQVGMGMKVETVVAVICACATLHNIALSVDDIMPMYCEDINVQNDAVATGENTNSNGCVVRQSLVDRFFC
ncbi:putative nuclease HARBI1 isoform X1 [Spodoptera frugiperda]|uniref:Putative nuclease HARBI1 n=1 Tax=Spodoptera frugiperda TaxID=7108 RepID=A0A9R0DH52_SPOFR|nr:putative nuclease HARBI1 isoform X1 [Spodoptera frugiperda]